MQAVDEEEDLCRVLVEVGPPGVGHAAVPRAPDARQARVPGRGDGRQRIVVVRARGRRDLLEQPGRLVGVDVRPDVRVVAEQARGVGEPRREVLVDLRAADRTAGPGWEREAGRGRVDQRVTVEDRRPAAVDDVVRKHAGTVVAQEHAPGDDRRVAPREAHELRRRSRAEARLASRATHLAPGAGRSLQPGDGPVSAPDAAARVRSDAPAAAPRASKSGRAAAEAGAATSSTRRRWPPGHGGVGPHPIGSRQSRLESGATGRRIPASRRSVQSCLCAERRANALTKSFMPCSNAQTPANTSRRNALSMKN